MQKSGYTNEAVITGIGVLSPIGNTKRQVLESLRALKDGIGEVSKIDSEKFLSHINAEVKDIDFSKRLSASEIATYTDNCLRMAIYAAREAIEDCACDVSGNDTAIVVATCNAGMNSQEMEYKAMLGIDNAEFTREVSLQGEFFALSRTLASALKIGGACFVINTACSGSTAAVAIAQMLVNQGRFKRVIAGGSDAMSIANYAGFSALKVVSEYKTAPFSNPVGMNIGEGAAFWIIESSQEASARSAKIYGKVIGHSTTGDAHHPTQPDPRGDGANRTMRNAANYAGVKLNDIACINAHGSGTSANDRAESKAIKKFIDGSATLFTSTKSYHGHCMGATGIIEATCQLLAMNADFIPPTLHFTDLRDGCELAPVSEIVEKSYDCFLSANYAFAGNNAAIVVAKDKFDNYLTRPNKKADVVISGVGMVSSLGIGLDENISALSENKIGIDDIERFVSLNKAGMVKLPNLRTINRRIDFSGMNTISAFSTIAVWQALESARLKIRRDNSEEIGLIGTVSKGSSEEALMLGVFKDSERKGDISCFSNVTANSTAGWVSKALEIKGANITFTSGHNCALQGLEYAQMLLNSDEAKQVALFSADEIYSQQMRAYSDFEYLRSGEFEDDFYLKFFSYYKTVLGEGAVSVLLESSESARSRGAEILGTVLGCASTMDGGDFYDANVEGDGLFRAVDSALSQAGVRPEDIDAISWSPRGTAQDSKPINLRDKFFKQVPIITTVFNTGYMETTSSLHSLLCLLQFVNSGRKIWKQRYGVEKLEKTVFSRQPKTILALASSFTGANYATVVSTNIRQ